MTYGEQSKKLIQHGNVIDKYINPTIANNQCKTAFMQSKTGTYESIMKIVQPPKGQPRKIKPIEQSNQPTQKEKVSEWLLCVLTNEPISTDDIVNQSQYEANLIDQALKDLCNKGLIEHLLLSQNKYTDYVDCYRKADQAALKISFTTDDMVKKNKRDKTKALAKKEQEKKLM